MVENFTILGRNAVSIYTTRVTLWSYACECQAYDLGGGRRSLAPLLPTSALDGKEWSVWRSCRFNSEEAAPPLIKFGVGKPHIGAEYFGGEINHLTLPKIESPLVQPVAWSLNRLSYI
jgi:hypothetical protein